MRKVAVAAVIGVGSMAAAMTWWLAFVGAWIGADRRLDRGHLHE